VTQFKEVKIPDGDLITYCDGALVIGDHPVIGVLRGDGIGLDITPVTCARRSRMPAPSQAGLLSVSFPVPVPVTDHPPGCAVPPNLPAASRSPVPVESRAGGA
jgi:hypothetical protein